MEGIFNKNFWLATLFAVVVMLLWDHFFLSKEREKRQLELAKNQISASINETNNSIKPVSTIKSEDNIKVSNIIIKNDYVFGSLSLQNGRIDNIYLTKYHTDLDVNSPNVHLFVQKGTNDAYYFESGWLGNNINNSYIWKSTSKELTPQQPVVLTRVIQGLEFTKTIYLDSKYMIKVVDKVVNTTSKKVDLSPYALITRHGDPDVQEMFINHEGFVGKLNSTLERVKYSDSLSKGYSYTTTGGYLGFTDKYFLSAIILDNNQNYKTRFLSFKDDFRVNNYQLDSQGATKTLAPGDVYESTVSVFVGPKEYNIIKNYEDTYKISNFDDTIDFGWFFFFTKPMIKFLLWIYHTIGSFGIAMLIFTVIIRAVIFPIAFKSYISMAKMRELAPKLKDLKKRYAKDMQSYNKQVMELYKKENVSPISGCLPLLLQIPIFFSIYKVIFISIELRHAPFFGWVHDLSAVDPTNLFNLFGLLPFNTPSFLEIGLWPILMGLSMYFQQKLSGNQALDPVQAKIMNFMPIVLTFVLAKFPVGLVIYWTWNNIISIIQQLVINKMVHKEFLNKKNKKHK